jgi:hypothetical protein
VGDPLFKRQRFVIPQRNTALGQSLVKRDKSIER